MGTKARSFTLATAAVSAFLLLGAPADKAEAQWRDRRSSDTRRGDDSFRRFRGDSGERGRSFGQRFDNRSFGWRFGDRSFDRRFDNRFGRRFEGRFWSRPFYQPFRTVRVFVYEPYPHWILRRVYLDDEEVVVEPDYDRCPDYDRY